jgi:hypothetical protein
MSTWKTLSHLYTILLILSIFFLSSVPVRGATSLTTDDQINTAIDAGLAYLHNTMTRNDSGSGYWDTLYPEAATAFAVLAFEVQGHTADGDPEKDPYVDTVRRGLNFLLLTLRQQKINIQKAGDPDTNGNGFGLYPAQDDDEVNMYTAGIVLMALAACGTPDEKAAVGVEGVKGRSYRKIAQDMVDYLAWAQNDSPENARGGWRYSPNEDSSDMSVTQWPAIGMEAAETNWGVRVPDWVKSELAHFLSVMQDEDGGFSYIEPSSGGNIARTGAGIIGLLWTGKKTDDELIVKAERFIAEQWDSDHIGNLYAMYGVAKGSRLAQPEPITHYGDYDWYQEYADYLVSRQLDDGSWDDEAYVRGNYTIATAWALLILSRTGVLAFVSETPTFTPELTATPTVTSSPTPTLTLTPSATASPTHTPSLPPPTPPPPPPSFSWWWLIPLGFLPLLLLFWLLRRPSKPTAVVRPGTRTEDVARSPTKTADKTKPEHGFDVTHGLKKPPKR